MEFANNFRKIIVNDESIKESKLTFESNWEKIFDDNFSIIEELADKQMKSFIFNKLKLLKLNYFANHTFETILNFKIFSKNIINNLDLKVIINSIKFKFSEFNFKKELEIYIEKLYLEIFSYIQNKFLNKIYSKHSVKFNNIKFILIPLIARKINLKIFYILFFIIMILKI